MLESMMSRASSLELLMLESVMTWPASLELYVMPESVMHSGAASLEAS